ncbi:hypothetical protein AB0436_27480 [Streptomyces sp. NPDC051322]|uniref:hypothetical protein n=1 Tax=Streptomyces sp. NPDC051322 TaxID=3154645 RepID=UPI00344E0EA2
MVVERKDRRTLQAPSQRCVDGVGEAESVTEVLFQQTLGLGEQRSGDRRDVNMAQAGERTQPLGRVNGYSFTGWPATCSAT